MIRPLPGRPGRPSRARVLLLGASPLAVKLVRELSARPDTEVIGVVDDAGDPDPLSLPVRRLGSQEQLARIIREERPARIVVTLTSRRGRLPVRTLLRARMQGVAVEDGVDAYERLTGKLAIDAMKPSALIFSKDFRSPPLQLALGRALSFLVAAAALLALLPLLAVLAALVVLDSPGPVLFRHDRVGRSGRRFPLLKFRTMRVSPRPTSEWAADNGERITRVGRWLRRFRLDELPQLVNVLRGEMNLVGPRPHPVSNFELFLREIPYYWIRSSVLPGITGWAQVRYRYANNLEEETEKMRYDLYYIKHMSWWLDLRILAETMTVVLFGRPEAVRRTARVVAIGSRAPSRRTKPPTLVPPPARPQALGWRRA